MGYKALNVGNQGSRDTTLVLGILRVQGDFRGGVRVAHAPVYTESISRTKSIYIRLISIILSILSPIRGGAIIGMFMI
jgi:hypothetical protein